MSAMSAQPCLRSASRVAVAHPSTLRAGGEPLDIAVLDLSSTGFAFESATPVAVGSVVHVGLAGAGRADAEVAWSDGQRHGCTFRAPLTPEECAVAFRGSTIVRLTPAAAMPVRQVAAPRPSPSPHLYVALMILIGGAGWFGIGAALRFALG